MLFNIFMKFSQLISNLSALRAIYGLINIDLLSESKIDSF